MILLKLLIQGLAWGLYISAIHFYIDLHKCKLSLPFLKISYFITQIKNFHVESYMWTPKINIQFCFDSQKEKKSDLPPKQQSDDLLLQPSMKYSVRHGTQSLSLKAESDF